MMADRFRHRTSIASFAWLATACMRSQDRLNQSSYVKQVQPPSPATHTRKVPVPCSTLAGRELFPTPLLPRGCELFPTSSGFFEKGHTPGRVCIPLQSRIAAPCSRPISHVRVSGAHSCVESHHFSGVSPRFSEERACTYTRESTYTKKHTACRPQAPRPPFQCLYLFGGLQTNNTHAHACVRA